MKMYILVRDSIAMGHAVVGVAHASLACYLAYRDTQEVATWLDGSFRKVVCRVNDVELARAKELLSEHVVITESSLGGEEIATAFKPRAEWPRAFAFYRLFR